jgi:hypothetical protein
LELEVPELDGRLEGDVGGLLPLLLEPGRELDVLLLLGLELELRLPLEPELRLPELELRDEEDE